ncbi:hypothetical protein IM660_15985 [Ruania alkalisoli]|uniref:Uncharacterized protein n=1 Tax=Ruania alkalisoli TaxID=2779775 RepID=A0A7M1SRN5_9MICO|nr:hypothetical protein [Ruania alkalisoli]QOR70111.1 hypothetical protein IM660_15985 [Ruania alkalisoli]
MAHDEFTIAGEDPAAAHATPPPRRRPQTWSGPWPWAMVAVVLLVAGVVTSPQGERPVPTADVAWSVPLSGAAHPGVWVIDDIVAVSEGDGIVGRAVADGDERWRVGVREPRCASDGVRLACVPSGPPSRATGGVITVIDADGGTMVAEVEGAQLASPLGEDLVVAGGTGDDERWLARIGPGDAQLWRTVVTPESPSRSVQLSFDELTVNGRYVTWWFAEDDVRWPEPGMLDPATGERLPTLTAAPYTSSLPLEFERTLTYLEADSRSSDHPVAVMTGGVAESVEGAWLWRWDADEQPIAVSSAEVATTVLPDFTSALEGTEPLGYATLRTRALIEGDAEGTVSDYRVFRCPCAWVGNTVVAQGYWVEDIEALRQRQHRIDLVMIQGTEVIERFEVQQLTAENPRAQEWEIATDDTTIYVRQGGRLLALEGVLDL